MKLGKFVMKQILKSNYTLNLEQLMKITLNLNKYMWHKLKVDQP